MHVETAAWTREVLTGLDLPRGSRALDVGSSTRDYRTREQPHIDEQVWRPLRERGVEIVHLDIKRAPGVDIVCDLEHPAPELPARIGPCAVVLMASLLQYLRDPRGAADLSVAVLARGGHLIVHHPESARRTFDPVDHRLRLTPGELAGIFERRGLERVRVESIRIEDPRYYRGLMSRASWVPIRGRLWLPLPGATDQVRLRIPALRWRQSCVVMRKPV